MNQMLIHDFESAQSYTEVSKDEFVFRAVSDFRKLMEDTNIFTYQGIDGKDFHPLVVVVMGKEAFPIEKLVAGYFNTDEFIFHYGDIGSKFYIILLGQVAIEIPDSNSGKIEFSEISG